VRRYDLACTFPTKFLPTTLLPNQTNTTAKKSPINRLHTPTAATSPMARNDRSAPTLLAPFSPVRPPIKSSRDVLNSWRSPPDETRREQLQRPMQRDTLQEGEGGTAEDADLPAARKRKILESPGVLGGGEINASREKRTRVGERGEAQGRQPGHAAAAGEWQIHASATPPFVKKRKRKGLNLEVDAVEAGDDAAARMAKRRSVHETEPRMELVTIRVVTEETQQSDASDSRSAAPVTEPDPVGEEDDRAHRAGNRDGAHPDVLLTSQDSMRVAAVEAGVEDATDAGCESPQRRQKFCIAFAGHADRPQRSALTTQRTASITTSSRTVTEAKYTVERLLRFSGSGRDRIWLVKWRDFALPTWQSEEILIEDLEDGGHWQRLTHAFA